MSPDDLRSRENPATDAITDEEAGLEAVRVALREWRAGDEGTPLVDVIEWIRRENP